MYPLVFALHKWLVGNKNVSIFRYFNINLIDVLLALIHFGLLIFKFFFFVDIFKMSLLNDVLSIFVILIHAIYEFRNIC